MSTRILIASDFHIGLTRSANHTAESSKRRELKSLKTLSQVLETPHDLAICAGDFFDKYSNSEQVLHDAKPFFDRFDLVVRGNHDSSNREDTLSSLALLKRWSDPRRASLQWTTEEGLGIWWVSHSLTQEHFVEDLLNEATLARVTGNTRDILLTHCSYDSPWDHSVSSLNMPRDLAEHLLETFDYIFLGHEHTPREDFNGRLIVVGSHFPTAFDNLNDKRHLVLTAEDGTLRLESITHWRASEHVYAGSGADAPPGKQFYDLTDADPKLPVALFRDGALGVRVAGAETSSDRVELPTTSLEGLPSLIAKELARDPKLLAMWNSLSADEVETV